MGTFSNRATRKVFEGGVNTLPGKAITKETFRKNTIRDMKKLGVFKAEYEPIIGIYAEIYEQYQRIRKVADKRGYSDGGDPSLMKRLEALRKEFITYSDRLCLNPKANDTVKIESPKGSRLEAALDKLEKQ